MDFRDSLSRLKKKLKHPLTGSKRKPDRTGAGASEERVDRAGPLLQPEPHITVGGGHDEGSGSNADVRQVHPTDRSPQPGQPLSVPVHRSEHDQETNVDGRGVSQGDSHPHSDAEVVVGSGPSREGNGGNDKKFEQVYLSPSAPSIPYGGNPDST